MSEEIKHTKKFGIVAILDALGASDYSEAKIDSFLKSRTEIINSTKAHGQSLASTVPEFRPLNVYMFGDSIIVTLELNENHKTRACIFGFVLVMAQFLFHSIQHGILFRGAFSIDNYIEDAKSNTVMGKAVTDAAAWYEKSDWMGLSCTPKTKYVLQHYVGTLQLAGLRQYLPEYSVPLKGGRSENLYTISWPRLFFDTDEMKKQGKKNPRGWFVELLKDFDIPFGTECKYENIEKYFRTYEEIEQESLNKLGL